ncbi:hypothetical protein KGF54_003181 [Candida jiufengensis]|uniref:uncharacterized protein n=1 Tax=Candida jiufengensis TaxID=497108 RepID=UPI0022250231|nr:uncharacterized protein KGF54_003181 [Candida jiufengensis]KAI5952315.1 hypothetical protein KGF54_003181 [Candida jiufengensis]
MTDCIELQSGTKISKESRITDIKAIKLSSNITICSNVTINNTDQNQVQIGKYTFIKPNTEIKTPIHIGAFVLIGSNCVAESKIIGNRVIVEDNVHLQSGSIIYECCIVKKDTIIPPKYIVPPFTEVSGVPGKNFTSRSLNFSYKQEIESEIRKLNLLGIS